METLFYNGLFQDEERKLLLIKLFVECKKKCICCLVFLYPYRCVFQVGSIGAREEAGLALALEHGKRVGLLKAHDRVVIFQKIGDSSVLKIIEYPD